MALRDAKTVDANRQQKCLSVEHPSNKGTLYVVSTPIGNHEDITLRALRVLRSVKIVAAEDSRVIGRLLGRFGITTEVCSLGPHSHQPAAFERIKSALLKGEDVAVVCDAGTPLIADPGGWLVKAAGELQCRVLPVPGVVAAIAALTISGLNTQRFTFDGFPPRSKSDRSLFFSSLAAEKRTIILYETRSYLPNTLRCLADSMGDNRQIAVMRDLTRTTETTCRGRLADMVKLFGNTQPRGEYVVVIEGLASD